MPSAFLNKFRTRSFRKHLVINILLGMVIAGLMHYFHDLPLIHKAETAGIDLLIKWNIGIIQKPEESVPVVFLDIDEETYRKWGEPVVSPRDKLAKLVKFARSGNPSIIVIDIDTSHSSTLDQPLTSAENALLNSLQPDTAGDSEAGQSQIFIVSGFRANLEDKGGFPEKKLSLLDPAINKNAYIRRVSPLFDLDLDDQTVRRWRFFEPTCNDNIGDVIPSAQLISVAHIKKSTVTLDQALNQYIPTDCSAQVGRGHRADSEDSAQTIYLGDLEILLGGDQLSSRIIYTIPWKDDAIDTNRVGAIPHNGQLVPLVRQWSAHTITESQGPLDGSLFKDRIVVIGGSYFDSRDYHMTPIGMMPGALVIINSIQSLLQFGNIERPPLQIIILLELLLIILVSLIFTFTQTVLGGVLSSLVIIVALLPSSFLVFRYGVWLDFALPLLAVIIHHLVAEWEAFFDKN